MGQIAASDLVFCREETPPVSPGQGWGGTTGLLENQCPGTSLTEGRCPPPYGVRVPVQRLCRGRRRPPLGQQQHGVPALPLPGRGRQNHPALQVLHSQLPPLQRPLYLPDSHHPPITTRLSVPSLTLHFTLTICAFHLGFGLVFALNPNPPMYTDGRREDSGRGVRELQAR